MTTLVKNKFNTLSRVLKSKSSVEFQHNGLFYEIFESVSSEGYIVNVYSNNMKDEDGEYLDVYELDGGLCTGSARDAIEFML